MFNHNNNKNSFAQSKKERALFAIRIYMQSECLELHSWATVGSARQNNVMLGICAGDGPHFRNRPGPPVEPNRCTNICAHVRTYFKYIAGEYNVFL